MTKTEITELDDEVIGMIRSYIASYSLSKLSRATDINVGSLSQIKNGIQRRLQADRLPKLLSVLNELRDTPQAREPEPPTCATCLNLCNIDNDINYCEFLGRYMDPNLYCESHVPAPALDDVREPRVRVKKTLRRETTPAPEPEPEIKAEKGTGALAACLNETWEALEEPDRCRLVAYALKIRSNYIPVQ